MYVCSMYFSIDCILLLFYLNVSVLLFPQGLMHSSGPVGRHRQLVLVLEGELYLIPFALLKGSSSNEYLYERFSLISVPSLGSLGATVKVGRSYAVCLEIFIFNPVLVPFVIIYVN